MSIYTAIIIGRTCINGLTIRGNRLQHMKLGIYKELGIFRIAICRLL